jgi:hypothetical protein
MSSPPVPSGPRADASGSSMDQIASASDERSDRRKPRLWDRIKHRNSSSPSLNKVGTKNWSSRSLPRLGSFGSLALSATASSSAKSSPANSPVLNKFIISRESVVIEEPLVLKDYFSTLPSEVKLQIFAYLPLKTLARVSMVHILRVNSDERCVSSGGLCVRTALY